nr:alpha/beta hydrolase [Aeromicrobium phragmitis]
MTSGEWSHSAPACSTARGSRRCASSTWWRSARGVRRSSRWSSSTARCSSSCRQRSIAGLSRRTSAARAIGGCAEDLAMLVDPWTGDEGQPALYRQMAQADERFTDEVEPLYGNVDEPTHIVWGTEDAWIPVDRAHRLQSLISGATLTLVEGAGHLIQLDAPAQLTAELTRWTELQRAARA